MYHGLLFFATYCHKLFPTCLPIGMCHWVGLELNVTRRLLVHMCGAHFWSENINVLIKTHDF